MNAPRPSASVDQARSTSRGLACVILASLLVPAALHAQNTKKNPTSKVYVSDVSGEAQIDIGDRVQDMAKKSVYNAQGTVIETKKAEKEEDKNKIFSTVVYSNGTGAFFDHDTRVEVKKFVQEPFTPNRVDMDVEPSISQTQAYVARGTVGLCNSKQVAGSNMNYATPFGSVAIRARKIVIESNDTETKISMLEGDGTVRAGALDMGGTTLRTGEQAIIRPGSAGRPNTVEIRRISIDEAMVLDDKVAMACLARKTVYFDVRDKQSEGGTGGGDAPVTAFDGTGSSSQSSSTGGSEIVAVPTVPNELPVQYTVSPATLQSPGGE